MRGIVVALMLAAGAAPGQAQFDPTSPADRATLVLARVRLAADQEFRRLPNCTCTMNVERSRRLPKRGRFEFVDQLRLEVALVDGKEVYSWPGAKQFEDRDLVDIVQGGAIGSGEFAGHARSVLLSGSTRLDYRGEEELDGRRVHRFDYTVPMRDSRYTVRMGQALSVVGYRGSFWAEVDSFQLRRLWVEIHEVPPQLELEGGSVRIDYEKREIGGSTFLLPESSGHSMVTRGGFETRNRTTYTNCRQYAGESSLIFDDPEEEESPATPAPPIEWILPKDLRVTMRLDGELRADGLAVGDEVTMTVWRDARQRREVWLAKGAKVRMRVAYLRCVESPVVACALRLRPETFEDANKTGRFEAELEEPTVTAMLRQVGQPGRSLSQSLSLGQENAPAGSSMLVFRGRRLANSYQTVWRTLEAPGDEDP